MKRYAIWDKQSPVIVPTGKVYSARQWMDKYPAAALDSITVVCAAGEINGGFFGTLGQMVQLYEAQGADFSACTDPEEKLAVIEAFEDALSAAEDTVSPEERIAAALEYQVLTSLEDAEQPADQAETE